MKYFLAIITTLLLVGCSSIDVIQYSGNQPAFSLFHYFSGETKGWGIVQDRKGKVTRQFVVTINGSINSANDLILDEYFDWNDGEKSRRTWTITADSSHTFSGKADDVIGVATGSAHGNALNWQYFLNVKVDDGSWKIHFDDWMYLQADNILINKTSMSKFGIHVGEVTIVFSKVIR